MSFIAPSSLNTIESPAGMQQCFYYHMTWSIHTISLSGVILSPHLCSSPLPVEQHTPPQHPPFPCPDTHRVPFSPLLALAAGIRSSSKAKFNLTLSFHTLYLSLCFFSLSVSPPSFPAFLSEAQAFFYIEYISTHTQKAVEMSPCTSS